MLLDNQPYTFDRVFRLGIAMVLIISLVWLLGYLSDVLIPFAVAFLLAYLTNPLVTLVQRKVKNHVAAVFISLGAVLVLVVIMGCLFIPLIMNEIKHMGHVLTALVNNSELAQLAAKRLPPDLWEAVKEYAMKEEVQQFFKTDSFWKTTGMVARKILPGAWGIITGTMGIIMWLVGLAAVGLYLVFLLIDYHKVREGWQELIPLSYRISVISFVKEFDQAMNRYFRAQAVVATIVGLLLSIGFGLVGIPLGILLGLFIGLLNMVPYLQLAGLIPAFFLALVHAIENGTSFWVVIALTALVFIIVQVIQDAVLVPKIMGKATGLSPAMILLSLSVWGKLLGMLGLLIALPMTCLLLAYYRRLLPLPVE